MRTGYVYLFTGTVSVSILGILHKLAEVKKCRSSAINVLLFSFSFLLVLFYMVFIKHTTVRAPLAISGMAVLFGVSSAVAILAFQEGIKHGPIATSWLIINLSSGVPTLGSIFIYHEVVNFRKAAALVVAAVSMFLLWKDKKTAELESRLAIPDQAGLGLGDPAGEDPRERK